MDPLIEVRDVTVDRDHAVTVVFADGAECRFGLEELRLACPCASCRGERERDRPPWPQPSSPRPLTITDAELVGAWGLGITWNDGHRTGIYPFESLRRWCEAGAETVPFAPDSGRGS